MQQWEPFRSTTQSLKDRKAPAPDTLEFVLTAIPHTNQPSWHRQIPYAYFTVSCFKEESITNLPMK